MITPTREVIRALMLVQLILFIAGILLMQFLIYDTISDDTEKKDPNFLDKLDADFLKEEMRWQSLTELEEAIEQTTRMLIGSMKAAGVPSMSLSVLCLQT
ncbi:hypothetical protein ElyMa_001471300 [Elysia marginata]|uniref:Uncharacterized protein n=1 Tax=Elysia marginata TaxID=1093978 RepID=A0AAV4J4I4_9GAST|nr:hypothetical protein ElyMa_001471300 [Elysia marginata]